MTTIFAITTNYQGRRRYVTGYFNRFDKSVNVELSEDRTLAKDFGSMAAAKFICSKIFNPYERTYVSEQLTMTTPLPATRLIGMRFSNHDRDLI